jgi:hypothetical protein
VSAEVARAMLVAAAEFGEETVRAFARRVLEHWADCIPIPAHALFATMRAPRARAMSPAERSRKWRAERRLKRNGEHRENETAERDDPQRNDTTGRDDPSQDETKIVSSNVSPRHVRVASRVAPRARTCDLNLSLDPSENQEIRGDEDTRDPPDQNLSLSLRLLPPATEAQRNETKPRNETKRAAKRSATTDPALPKGTRIPQDWRPSAALIEWASREHRVDAVAVAPEFVDHWRSVPGNDGLKADWDGTFRNRVRYLVRRGEAPPLCAASGPTLARARPARDPPVTAEERAESARCLGDALENFRKQNAARGGT